MIKRATRLTWEASYDSTCPIGQTAGTGREFPDIWIHSATMQTLVFHAGFQHLLAEQVVLHLTD